MNLKSLETFYWVVRLNSFQRAAIKLCTTQPAVSQRISGLESDLGVRILDRTSRSIRITSKGRIVFDYADRFLRLRSELLDELGEKKQVTGIVRLGVVETLVQTWLVQFVEAAHKRFPSLTIDIVVDISPVLREAVCKGDLDMAFVIGPRADSDLVERELCAYELRFVASPRLGLGGRGPLGNAQLLNHPLITLPKKTYPYTFLRDALTMSGNQAPRFFTNSSISAVIKMGLHGLGICVLPPVVIQKELDTGALELLPAELVLRDLSYTAVFVLGADDRLKGELAELAFRVASVPELAEY